SRAPLSANRLQLPAAGPRGCFRRERGTRSCSGAMAPPWPAARMTRASASSRRCPRASPTCRSPLERGTRSCSRTMAPPWPAAGMMRASASSRRCPRASPTRRSPLEGITRSCSRAMAPPWPAAGMLLANATARRIDGSAVACGWNDAGQCELPALPAGLTYMAHLLPGMLLQASLDGDTMRFMTFGGAERSRSWAGPGARLADIYEQLLADHRAGRLGPGAWRVDAVLPGGRLLSRAAAEETVAEAVELPRAT
ncbi:unnamed protein product, partial [Prorocentrum cordatum]